jgi:hypothetical protein
MPTVPPYKTGFGSTSLHDALTKEHGAQNAPLGLTDNIDERIEATVALKKIGAGGPGSGRHPDPGKQRTFSRNPNRADYYKLFPEENPTHPEAAKAMKLLRERGYKGFGKTSAASRGYDKVHSLGSGGPGVGDSHRVHVNRYTGGWESGKPHYQSTESYKTGNGADSLRQHLDNLKLPPEIAPGASETWPHGPKVNPGYTDPNNIKAGGPGSGRKSEGLGSKVHSLAERLKAYEKTWSPKGLDKKPFSSKELPDDY